MKRMIALIVMGLLLTSCSLFRTHKLDVDQGNVISQENVSQLHRGMSEEQVKSIMGTPVLVNIFSTTQVEYVYTFQAGYGALTEKRVSCTFRSGRLVDIQTSVPPVQAVKQDDSESRRDSLSISSTFNYGLNKVQNGYKKVKSLIWV